MTASALILFLLLYALAVCIKHPLKTKIRRCAMFHNLIRAPFGFNYDIISMKTRRIVQPIIRETENVAEYVLLNGLYLMLIYETEEKASWLKRYMEVNHRMKFEFINNIWVCKFLIHNGSVVPLRFKGNLSDFLAKQEAKQSKNRNS